MSRDSSGSAMSRYLRARDEGRARLRCLAAAAASTEAAAASAAAAAALTILLEAVELLRERCETDERVVGDGGGPGAATMTVGQTTNVGV